MGCGCGGGVTPQTVDENTPNPNELTFEELRAIENDAWWQANPMAKSAVPMPA